MRVLSKYVIKSVCVEKSVLRIRRSLNIPLKVISRTGVTFWDVFFLIFVFFKQFNRNDNCVTNIQFCLISAIANAMLAATLKKSRVVRENLELEKKIDFGRYGDIYQGTWTTRKLKKKSVVVKDLTKSKFICDLSS